MNNKVESEDRSISQYASPFSSTGQAMEVISGKWKMQIISYLFIFGNSRLTDIQKGITGVSSKVLSKELLELKKNDLVTRTENRERNTVKYQLTEHGKTLYPVLSSVEYWAKVHFSHLQYKNENEVE